MPKVSLPLPVVQCEVLRTIASEPLTARSISSELVRPMTLAQTETTLTKLMELGLVYQNKRDHGLITLTKFGERVSALGCSAQRQGFVCEGCVSPHVMRQGTAPRINILNELLVIQPCMA